ncbi:MAG: histidinol phosphatase [Candidatus Dormibacteraeota bacterium]|nr:histidinol phosphatase [Candidatus Dormibacteraeota bacterium]
MALRLADAADQITMRHFRSVDLRVEDKPDHTPVSNADREVEEMIRDRLAESRPGDAVVGEEYGASGDGRRRWIIDPIDATRNYIRGIPVFATLLALEEDEEVVVGVVSAPALQARWRARRGEGAFGGNRRLQVSGINKLADANLCHAGLDDWREARGSLDPLLELARRCGRSRGFGDFWQHMLVAQGSAEMAVEPAVSLWDMAAVKVIVEEAGGTFSDLSGALTAGGGDAISSNGLLHQAALDLIGRPAP